MQRVVDARRGHGCRGPVQGKSEDESEAISEGMPAGVPITYLTSSPRHRQRRGFRGPARHGHGRERKREGAGHVQSREGSQWGGRERGTAEGGQP